MSFLFNKPSITKKDVDKAYEIYLKDNKQITLKSFESRFLTKRYKSFSIGTMVFPYNQKLGVKFDFYMIDMIEKTIKKERIKKRIMKFSSDLAMLYFDAADHLSYIFSDFDKIKLFYLTGLDLDPANVSLVLRYGLGLSRSTEYNDKMNAYRYIYRGATMMTKGVWSLNPNNKLDRYVEYIDFLMGTRVDNSKFVYNLLKEGYKIAKFDEFKDESELEIVKKYLHVLFNGYKSVKPKPKQIVAIIKTLDRCKIEYRPLVTEKMLHFVDMQNKEALRKKEELKAARKEEKKRMKEKDLEEAPKEEAPSTNETA